MNYGNKMNKNSYLFTFGLGFMIGLSLLIISFAQEPDYQIPEWSHFPFSQTWTIEKEQNWTWKQESKWTRSVVVNKQPTVVSHEWNPTNQEITKEWTKSVLDCNAIVLHNDQATEIARYMCNIEPDRDMLATFMQESGFHPRAKWLAWEKWICQLMANSTNIVRLKDPRWNDRKRQAEVCIDKWKAVPKKWVIWMAYAVRHKYLHHFQ